MDFFEILDTKTGDDLDKMGRRFAQRYSGESDESYRERVKNGFSVMSGHLINKAKKMNHKLGDSDLAKEIERRNNR